MALLFPRLNCIFFQKILIGQYLYILSVGSHVTQHLSSFLISFLSLFNCVFQMSLWIGSRMSMKSLSGCAVGMEYREKRMLTQVSLIKAAMCLSQVRTVRRVCEA